MSDVTSILYNLKSKGYKLTKPKQELLETIIRSDHPISVIEILEEYKKRKLSVNKTTLYRQLEVFVYEGIVTEVDFGDGKKRYEIASGNHHHHLICTGCKKIKHIELPGDLISQEILISKLENFQVSYHLLEFFGLCYDCQHTKGDK